MPRVLHCSTTGLLQALLALLAPAYPLGALAQPPAEVDFLSADGRTMLRGFVFVPKSEPPWPAIVMLHGRSGPYSASIANRCSDLRFEISRGS